MNGLDLGIGALEQDMWRVVFLMTRIGAALLAAPFFGATAVPMSVRIAITGALAIFVSVWMPAVATPDALLSLAGLLAIAGEVIVGLALGFDGCPAGAPGPGDIDNRDSSLEQSLRHPR